MALVLILASALIMDLALILILVSTLTLILVLALHPVRASRTRTPYDQATGYPERLVRRLRASAIRGRRGARRPCARRPSARRAP